MPSLTVRGGAIARTLPLLACAAIAAAQERTDTAEIQRRLDLLEAQNREITEQIRQLRQLLAASSPASSAAPPAAPAEAPLGEQVAVHDRRIEELDQSKVSAEHRLPVTLTGTALFNAFINGTHSGGQMNPTVASAATSNNTSGASVRQTILGFRFEGPALPGGGKASGTLFFDFFAGTGTSTNELFRLRVATLDLAWKNTTLSFGQDKPIFAPRDPDSLAQVGVSPLTSAGNLWLWSPQAKLEQRVAFSPSAGLKAQIGVYQTNEAGAGVPSEYAASTPNARLALQSRFEFWKELSGGRRWEIAPSFHISQSHTAGQSVPSRILSADWLLRPHARLDFSGQLFYGENVAVTGSLRQGIVFTSEKAHAVHAAGGWAQLTFRATPRLRFNLYGGQQDDRNSDLNGDAIAKNQIYAANAIYRLGQNVLASFEYSRVRTTYLSSGIWINPHYDLALAYLF